MAGFALKVKTKSGQQVLHNFTGASTLRELKAQLCKISEIPPNRLSVLSGYPPKIVDISDDDLCLSDACIKSGDTLIIQEKAQDSVETTKSPTLVRNEENIDTSSINDCVGILMKQVVPADNSCLFTSIHYVLNGKVEDSAQVAPPLRQIIASTVRQDTVNYSEAILGKPTEDYCKWIMDDSSWGGGIELAVLSKYFGIEIAVVDTINALINRFGEDQNYGNRVFLLFDGIHYDPLYLEPFDGSKNQTIFRSDDDKVLRDAEQLAQEAKSSRQFTDVNKFTLKCMVCNVMLTGQVQAQQHATQTGHANFGEV